jgi:hemerythrin-like domain-containing protein
MNSTGPIKRNRYVEAFSRDHHFGLLLVRRIRQGVKAGIAPERLVAYIVFVFTEDLSGHFKEEEELLFPLLPENDILRKQAADEHEQVYDLLDTFALYPFTGSTCMVFADLLERHIRFEERALFNHIQVTATEEQLKHASGKMAVRSHDYDAKWEDTFWIT